MTDSATTPGPVVERRAGWSAPILLGAFLLLASATQATIFFLGPLAVFLALSRPRTVREWGWLLLAVAALYVTFRLPPTLGDRTVRAAGLFFTGTFAALTVLGVPSLFTRVALAVLTAAATTAAGFAALGLRWSALREGIITRTWAGWQALMPELPARPEDAGTGIAAGETGQVAAQLAQSVQLLGDFLPGWLALLAFAGGWLAWQWTHRVARHPIGPAPRPFRAFRFNDQLIWAVVLALGALLLPLPPAPATALANLLFVLGGLYAARGLAVLRSALLPAPPAMTVLLCCLALPVLPLALSGCAVLGVADTWLDLRRRLPSPQGVN
ncbi:MAG TPA: DUF2232 domain-containing protein [Gemmatimonadales bacterium]|nr:DUF2232 domain-containing protein [Gemmatimonadales bacterium]